MHNIAKCGKKKYTIVTLKSGMELSITAKKKFMEHQDAAGPIHIEIRNDAFCGQADFNNRFMKPAF